MKKAIPFLFLIMTSSILFGNDAVISGKVTTKNIPLGFATVVIENSSFGTTTDENGLFSFENCGK